MMLRSWYQVIVLFCLISGIAFGTAFSQQGKCDPYRQFPKPGHPVALVDLHPTDRQFPFLSELGRLKLILMEPGICEVKMAEEGWFQGRVFVFRTRSENFQHGDIIEIEAGKFK